MDLDPDECRVRFAAARIAVLGTIGPAYPVHATQPASAASTPDIAAHQAGRVRPHLVPITFALRHDMVVSAVDHKPKRHRALRRLANIEDHPEVSLLVEHADADWDRLWWVRADGLASVLPAGSEPVDWLLEKYPQYRLRPPEGAVIRIEITRWVGWAAGA